MERRLRSNFNTVFRILPTRSGGFVVQQKDIASPEAMHLGFVYRNWADRWIADIPRGFCGTETREFTSFLAAIRFVRKGA